MTPIHYRGKVWCVRVPSGAFVARRNGQVFITGNSGFPKRVRLDLKIDQYHGKAGERPVVGKSSRHGGGTGGGSSWNIPSDVPNLTGPATHDAARFVGWDRALRPGWEPIIVACKPLRGTVAENALAHGTGGLHVDACRLERGDAEVTPQPDVRPDSRGIYGKGLGGGLGGLSSPLGGYPANVAMDEDTAALLDQMGGPCGGAAPASGPTFHGRADGASRFFYTAKASSSERDAGLEDLPPLTAGERCGREDGSAGVNGYAGTRGEGGRNPHPTVKPLSLMRWLCRLASPPGARDPDESRRPVILDPFAGSGSTLVAALQEGMRVIGCELDEKMADVARRRCQHAYALPREEADIDRSVAAPGTQATLF